MRHNKLYYLFNPRKGIHALRLKLSDRYAISCAFRERLGYDINWKNPQTFSEKLQWLKIYDRKPIYTKLVDKYEVKRIVAKKIGGEYIIPTLGVWENFSEINFDQLPNQFVLKCTHDSGSIVLCEDKRMFDYNKAKAILERGLRNNFFYNGREWPYKNVPPRIIAEEYMKNNDDSSLTDYKFYCFNGKPKFLYVSYGLADHSSAYINYVTLDWQKAPFRRPDFIEFEELPPKPIGFECMLNLAEVLSAGIPFLRVDFYEINNKIYFSELTFSPGSGYTPFIPQEYDRICGDFLQLPNTK